MSVWEREEVLRYYLCLFLVLSLQSHGQTLHHVLSLGRSNIIWGSASVKGRTFSFRPVLAHIFLMCRRFQFIPASSGGLSRISPLLYYLWWEKQLVLVDGAQRDDKACKSTLMSSDVLYVLAALPQHKYISLSHAISAQAQCKHRSISSHTQIHTHARTHTKRGSNIESISPSDDD